MLRQLSLSWAFNVHSLWPSCLFYAHYHPFIFNTCVHGSNTCVNSSRTYFGPKQILLLEISLDLVLGITLHYPLHLLSCGLFFDLFHLLLRVFSSIVFASDSLRQSWSLFSSIVFASDRQSRCLYWTCFFLFFFCLYYIMVSLYLVYLFYLNLICLLDSLPWVKISFHLHLIYSIVIYDLASWFATSIRLCYLLQLLQRLAFTHYKQMHSMVEYVEPYQHLSPL